MKFSQPGEINLKASRTLYLRVRKPSQRDTVVSDNGCSSCRDAIVIDCIRAAVECKYIQQGRHTFSSSPVVSFLHSNYNF